MEKNYFKCFRLFLDTWKKISDINLKAQYYEGLLEYWLNGTKPTDPIIDALLTSAMYSIDKSDEERERKSESMKGNLNAVKTWENISKQSKTDINSNEQIKTYEEKKNKEEYKKNKEDNNTNTVMCNKLHDEYWFEKFWNEYPVKKDKKKAQEKFQRLSLDKRRLAIEWIFKLRQSDQWKKWFIPLPTTYLNWERREDEVENKSFWIEQLKEKERQRIREEAQAILSPKQNENGQSIQTEWYNRRSDFESS